MFRKVMGRDLIGVKEAAELLDVSPRSVHHFVRQGLLKPRYERGRGLNAPEMFHKEEVVALSEVRREKVDFKSVVAAARQAHASSRSLERRVEFLEKLLGHSIVTLSLEHDDVVSMYAAARAGIEVPPVTVDGVMHWSKIFLALGEEFLEELEAATSDPDAWSVFMDLSAAMLRDAPLDDFLHDKELEAAYGYFKYARENMRRAIYFHLRNRFGDQAARRFGAQDSHSEVLRLLSGVFSPHP